MFTVAALWRYPIKSHGREEIESVTLVEGKTMPWDRHWAVTHERSKFDADNPEWVQCRNFMIGAQHPQLAGFSAKLDEATGQITLDHRDLGKITVNPDDAVDQEKLLNWMRPLYPEKGRHPTAVVSAPDRGMTDSSKPTISLMNTASHRAVAGKLGRPLEMERWRGNIWLDGPALWEEFEWIGKELRIGAATLYIRKPILRCPHTMANPVTGVRDTPTLQALEDGWGHQDFGVYALVTKGGKISVGDTAEVL